MSTDISEGRRLFEHCRTAKQEEAVTLVYIEGMTRQPQPESLALTAKAQRSGLSR